MESKDHLDKLLTGFLSDELNDDEVRHVLAWLHESEENRNYFETLKTAWRLTSLSKTMGNINVDDECKRFSKAIKERQNTRQKIEQLSPYKLKESAGTGKKIGIKVLLPLAIAASLLTIFVSNYHRDADNNNETKTLVAYNKPGIERDSLSLQHKKNSSDADIQFQLMDGTIVILSPNSEISYTMPFSNNRRDIQLTGKANFKVAKDKSKPFTVYSDDIATTALGTDFTVSSYKNARHIYVSLYEGEVVINLNGPLKNSSAVNYYMQPNEQLIYNKKEGIAKLVRFDKKRAQLVTSKADRIIEETTPDSISLPKKSGSWYMFNNEPLEDVIDQLKIMYRCEILYTKSEIENIYFIGTFEKSDPIDKILSNIAHANNLKISKENNYYILYK